MAKTVIELLKEVAKKAGLNIEEEKFKTFFENAELAKFEVPDDVLNPINNQLISLQAAKSNHPDIKNHYTALALNALDQNTDSLMDALGFTDDQKNQVKVERSSYKRPELIIKLVQQLEQAKASADKPDKAAIQKQIDELHAQLRTANEKATQAEAQFKDQEKRIRLQYKLDSMLNPHKTVYDNLDPEVKFTTLRTLLDNGLQNAGAKFDLDEHGNLILLKKDGMNFFGDNNQQVNAGQYIEQLLSKNKLLVVNDINKQNNSTNTNGQSNGNNNQNAGTPPKRTNTTDKAPIGENSVWKDIMDTAMKEAQQKDPVMG